jgi:polysaccharide transporter, PST family
LPTALTKFLAKPLVANSLALYAVQGLNYLMPLLLLPFLLRALSPEGYGQIMLAQALMGYALILIEFGFNFTAARDISIARHDAARVAEIFWTTTVAKMSLLVVSGVVVGAIVTLTPRFRHEWSVFAASGLLLLGNVTFPQWYFQGLERLRAVALIQTAAKCVVTLSAILLVHSRADVFLAALILAAPQVIGAALTFIFRIPLWPRTFYRPTRADVLRSLRESRHLFTSNIATTLYLNTNTFVLGIVIGDRAVASYSVSNRIVAAVQGLATPVTQSAFPRLSHLFAHHPPQAWQLLRRVSFFLLPGMLIACLGVAALAPTIVTALAGHDYAEAIPVLRIMAAVPLLVTVAVILAQLVMVNIGLQRELSLIYLGVGVLNLALLLPLLREFAAAGAAISLVISECCGPALMALVILVYKRRHATARIDSV